MPESQFYTRRLIKAYREGFMQDIFDPVVIEIQMTIVVNGAELVALACSPANLEELAVGYLVSEGVLSPGQPVDSLKLSSNHTVLIESNIILESSAAKTRVVNTCMGKGQTSPTVVSSATPAGGRSDCAFNAKDLLAVIDELNNTSETFRLTGGVHSAGLGQGSSLLVRYEDIGRHNAVDKVFGYAFLNKLDMDDKYLVLSGRIAGEILMKAARNGVSLILSRSAPTLRTVELAEELGLTIVGFARGERFNVYSHWDRIHL